MQHSEVEPDVISDLRTLSGGGVWLWWVSKTCLLFLCLVAATKEVEVQSRLEVSRTGHVILRVLLPHVTH